MKKKVRVKLLKKKGQTRSIGRNLIKAIFKYGAVKTSESKAKRLKVEVDRLVNLGQRSKLNAGRLIKQRVADWGTTKKILAYAQKQDRQKSGFTKLQKIGFQRGDGTKIARLELLNYLQNKEVVKSEKIISEKNAPKK